MRLAVISVSGPLVRISKLCGSNSPHLSGLTPPGFTHPSCKACCGPDDPPGQLSSMKTLSKPGRCSLGRRHHNTRSLQQHQGTSMLADLYWHHSALQSLHKLAQTPPSCEDGQGRCNSPVSPGVQELLLSPHKGQTFHISHL